jgi:MFS family permease
MGGEWSLGVALVMEVWEAKRRPLLAGLIGAAANVGFLSIAVLGLIIPVTDKSWRWVMLAGALPALLTFFIRLFVPESQKWKASQQVAPSKPLRELFSSNLVGVMLLAIAFASIALIGTWGSVQKIPAWVSQLHGGGDPRAKAHAQIVVAFGAIIGCMIAPKLANVFSRRFAYLLLCIGSLASCQILFRTIDTYNYSFLVLAFVAGGITAAFYGWMPLYLPELFPTRVRATAQGIAYNFGRIAAAAGAWWGGTIGGSYAQMGAIVSLIYILGIALIWLAPETKGRPLPA